jgi:hypothetical protein
MNWVRWQLHKQTTYYFVNQSNNFEGVPPIIMHHLSTTAGATYESNAAISN